MEMRLNERKQQNEHNQKKGIVNREIIPHLRLNVYPKRRFCGHVAGTCTRKGGFGYMWGWQGLMDSDHRMTELAKKLISSFITTCLNRCIL